MSAGLRMFATGGASGYCIGVGIADVSAGQPLGLVGFTIGLIGVVATFLAPGADR